MATEAPLDAMILGDSHAVALKAGCDKLGLRTGILSISGNLWHAGFVRFHRRKGMVGRATAQRRINEFKQNQRFEIVPPSGLPVIATLGFHLGRVVPMFALDGHRTDEAEFQADPAHQYVSRGMLRAYINAFRRQHIEFLTRLAQMTPTLVVAPPFFWQAGNAADFTTEILAMMSEAGLATLNPCAELYGAGVALPEEYRTADGIHGNAEYGAQAVDLVLRSGFLNRP